MKFTYLSEEGQDTLNDEEKEFKVLSHTDFWIQIAYKNNSKNNLNPTETSELPLVCELLASTGEMG